MELRRHLGRAAARSGDARLHADPRPAGAARGLCRASLLVLWRAIAPGEVGITSGCNQAFCLALMSIARAGDEVILPRPHYFNHDMWMRMQGIDAGVARLPAGLGRGARCARRRRADHAAGRGRSC
jgi:DNA-binding transcriptional MocR family regulator